MTPVTDDIEVDTAAPPRVSPEGKLFLRRARAGSRNSMSVFGGPPSRTLAGAWMWRTTLDLPEAVQLELEARAATRQVPVDQIIREALVAAGIGQTSDIAAICDGTCADDAEQAEAEEASRRMREQARQALALRNAVDRDQARRREPTA